MNSSSFSWICRTRTKEEDEEEEEKLNTFQVRTETFLRLQQHRFGLRDETRPLVKSS
jgi:hypothetical protein